MRIADKWRAIDDRHIIWDLQRYLLSIRGSNNQAEWLDYLRENHALATEKEPLPIDPENVALFFEYLEDRERLLEEAFELLRTEEESKAFCESKGITFGVTATQSEDHYQSSKSLVAAVTEIARDVCEARGVEIDPDPQQRAVWCNQNGLHVTARNLDGAIPATVNPIIVWEIKEYWGKTGGGSKMSDAVYECALVGRELRDFERDSGTIVVHAAFVDGKEQWLTRKADLGRFIDLAHQGLIDHLFIGRDVEQEWESVLKQVLTDHGH